MHALKIICCGITLCVGKMGVKTFKPMYMEIKHPRIFHNTTGKKHSENIKNFQKCLGKKQMVMFVIMVASMGMFRHYITHEAERFIKNEYRRYD